MNPKKVKILAVLGLVIFFVVEIMGAIFFVKGMFVIASVLFVIGVILFYAFFGFLGPYIKKMSEDRNFKCKKCGHLFKFSSVYRAVYPFSLFDIDVLYAIIYSIFNVSFFTKCPNCHRRSWCKLKKAS